MTLDFLGSLERTHTCGQLRAGQDGAEVVLMGWVNRRRDHGHLIFLDVRDRTGITQVVLDKETSSEAHARAEAARPEYVVAVKGKVRQRGAGLENPNMPTGAIEVVAQELLLLNEAKTPPFSPAEDAIANEEVRLKYRYLDLRRPQMQQNLELRSKVAMAIRNYLVAEGFLEIETPFMTRSTPEGARDYLVPSRVHAGSFYALPQSPQIFKQILMISGFDRYFQIARCFRDEDLRADRQPEFTQIDLEMTFPQQAQVFRVVEGFLTAAFAAAGVTLTTPFVQMTYDEAIRNYGIDKPDMRLPAMVDLTRASQDLVGVEMGLHWTSSIAVRLGMSNVNPLIVVCIPAVGELTGREKRDLPELWTSLQPHGVVVAHDFKRFEKSDPELAGKIRDTCSAKSSDLLLIVGRAAPSDLLDDPVQLREGRLESEVLSAEDRQIHEFAGALRLQLAAKFAEKHGLFTKTGKAADFKFCWVTDFPMYEWDEEHKRWDAAHHPFTSPHEEDIRAGKLTSDKGAVRALAYDIVLNGTELGSGSIRIHRQDVQAEIFRSIGLSEAEAKEGFGFFLDALEYGTPPHGGIALGLDRIVMILAGATSLREVIAFPKTAKAIDLMVDAPTPVSEQQMRELHLKTVVKG